MWCVASASTRMHETDRHTRRFDFDSSNSSSVVFVICSLKYVEQKERVCLFSVFCLCASLPCSTLFRGHVLSCFFSSYSLFHLASDLARFCFQFRSCFTVHPPPSFLADVLTFTHFPTLTLRLHTPNKSILHSPQLERHSEVRQAYERAGFY